MPYSVYSCPNKCKFKYGLVYAGKYKGEDVHIYYDLINEEYTDKTVEGIDFTDEEFNNFINNIPQNNPICCPVCKKILKEKIHPCA